MKAGEQRRPDYLAINPMGKVPALKHGDALVAEQVAIFLYLADLFPEAGLAPPVGDPLRDRPSVARAKARTRSSPRRTTHLFPPPPNHRAAGRPLTSAPASGAILRKNGTDSSEINATPTKAG
jgi:glutathione S-transferase